MKKSLTYCILLAMKRILSSFLLLFVASSAYPQTVGLVLSGGGAKGMAHIGVLRALEENNIPIDYISGSSIGAMVGSLYASGYTPDEIEMIFSSQRFKQWQSGNMESEYYYSYMKEINSEMLSVKFKVDSAETKAYIPSSIVAPHQMDFAFMQILSAPAAAANYDFDKLYIPFRCMATDIYARKPVAFREGYLPSAVRASMTFPLYFKPIEIDGRLLFDGGIYDNFPKKVMKEDFAPDIIIGVKVASNYDKAEKDDIIGQLENMIAGHTDYSLDEEKGILIDIKLYDVQLMDFESAAAIEKKGYAASMDLMDSIKSRINRRVSPYERNKARLAFRNKYPKMIFDSIQVEGLKKNQEQYVKNLISIKKDHFGIDKLKEQYNKMIASEHIDNMYPIALMDSGKRYYTLHLPIEKAKKFKAGIGGNFSLTDMNSAYIGGSYRLLGKRAHRINANMYIGSFYNSAELSARTYFPVKSELFTNLKVNYAMFNFQNGKTNSFYEDRQAPYIVQNELYAEFAGGLPVSNNSYLYVGYNWSANTHRYYQHPSFSSQDTPDKSLLKNHKLFTGYELSTLNRRNYADKGRFISFHAFYTTGTESHTPGSTSLVTTERILPYSYFTLKAKYTGYFNLSKRLTLGADLNLLLSDKPFMSNYTATISDAQPYNPFPYAATLFNEKYRAHNYLASGMKAIVHFTDALSFRIEAQLFQPYQKISPQLQDNIITAVYEEPYINRYYTGRVALVYHSLVGPVYAAWHYFQNFSHDFYFSAGLGFYIFNKSSKH